MINKVTFKKDFRVFKEGDSYPICPITLLVGDQGCGKSTLIALLSQRIGDYKEIVNIEIGKGQKVSTMAMDFEKDNIRIGQANFDRAMDTVGAMGAIGLKYKSHGEVVKLLLAEIKNKKNTTFIMDEPDMALSIRSCHQLVKDIKESATNNNNQFILAVHNPILVHMTGHVLNLEQKTWMTSEEFEVSHNID